MKLHFNDLELFSLKVTLIPTGNEKLWHFINCLLKSVQESNCVDVTKKKRPNSKNVTLACQQWILLI